MTSCPPRRQFLKQTTMAVAAGLAAGSPVAADQPGNATADRPLRIGVMGMSRGRALAATFAGQANTVVHYLCDVDRKRLDSAAAEIQQKTGQVVNRVTDFRRILDDPSVDALICAAPNHWHAPATILACQAGKHVYVEKPCSHNPHEGELMVQAARKHNRVVQMGTQRRSSSGTRAAIEALRAGVIGRVYLARCWYNNLRGSILHVQPTAPPDYLDYELWQGPAPRRPYRTNVVHYNWHWQWHWGNGELGNNGVHTLDLCRWGLGVDYPQRVTSSGGRYVFDDDQQTPDTHTVCFDFPGERSITWEGLSCNRHGGRFVAFYGTEGALELDGNGNHRVYNRRDELVDEQTGSRTGDQEHAANFLTAVRTNRPESAHARILEGHKSTLLCHLGNIAHRVGRSLTCDVQSGRIVDDDQAMLLWRREYEPGWEPTVA